MVNVDFGHLVMIFAVLASSCELYDDKSMLLVG